MYCWNERTKEAIVNGVVRVVWGAIDVTGSLKEISDMLFRVYIEAQVGVSGRSIPCSTALLARVFDVALWCHWVIRRPCAGLKVLADAHTRCDFSGDGSSA